MKIKLVALSVAALGIVATGTLLTSSVAKADLPYCNISIDPSLHYSPYVFASCQPYTVNGVTFDGFDSQKLLP